MENKFDLSRMISSLIEAIDTYNYLLGNHQKRTTYIAYKLGKEYGLNEKSLANLVIASSIHDVGALHENERNQIFSEDAQDSRKHELVAMKMLEGFEPYDYIREIIGHHHIRYYDFLTTIELRTIPYECFFLHLADRIDVIFNIHYNLNMTEDDLIKKIELKFGEIFNPQLRDTFSKLFKNTSWLVDYDPRYVQQLIDNSLKVLQLPNSKEMTYQALKVFSRIVDYKSLWTRNHSECVSKTAAKIAELLNFEDDRIHHLRVAGYLHDIGKIAVPSELFDKEGNITNSELAKIKSHAAFSSLILSKIDNFDEISRWASCHHERRDKSGYPLSLNENYFTIEVDILAYADMFVALKENRPYRKHLEDDQLLEVLHSESNKKLSPHVFRVIERHFDELSQLNSYVTTFIT